MVIKDSKLNETKIYEDDFHSVGIWIKYKWDNQHYYRREINLPAILEEIYNQFDAAEIICVVWESPIDGTVYRCKASHPGQWEYYGHTVGMA